MSTSPADPGILVGVDGSEFSDAAVRWAVAEAALHHEPLTLMTVAHRQQPYIATYDSAKMLQSRRKQHAEVDRILAQARRVADDAVSGRELASVQTRFLFAHPLFTLVDASQDARMVVVGSRGTSALDRLTLGSISSGLVRHAYCPVTVVHPTGADVDGQAPILLGIDGSPASEFATAIAFDEASRRRAPLIAMHAWADTFSDTELNWTADEAIGAELLSERLAGWQGTFPDVRLTPTLVHENPGRWLATNSGRAQLVVVGSHGRGGFAGMLLGSVSSTVVHAADAPVIVARQP